MYPCDSLKTNGPNTPGWQHTKYLRFNQVRSTKYIIKYSELLISVTNEHFCASVSNRLHLKELQKNFEKTMQMQEKTCNVGFGDCLVYIPTIHLQF